MNVTLNDMRDQAHRIAKEHGFKDTTVGEDIALMHSELSEALEDHRAGRQPAEMFYEERLSPYEESTHTTAGRHLDGSPFKPCGIPSEMADVIIRVLHFCGKHDIDIARAVSEKMAFNEAQPFKHGKVM